MSDTTLTRRASVRYVVRWRKLPELIALCASAALWATYLLRG